MTMIANVNGKEVRVMHEDGKLHRIFRCNSEAVSAYVNGNQVNVQLANGHSEIYTIDGMILRRF